MLHSIIVYIQSQHQENVKLSVSEDVILFQSICTIELDVIQHIKADKKLKQIELSSDGMDIKLSSLRNRLLNLFIFI